MINRAIDFIYPMETRDKVIITDFHEMKQYLINLLNLCTCTNEMYRVLPKPLHNLFKGIIFDVLDSDEIHLHFEKEFITFQKDNIHMYKKLEKLLTIKLLTE